MCALVIFLIGPPGSTHSSVCLETEPWRNPVVWGLQAAPGLPLTWNHNCLPGQGSLAPQLTSTLQKPTPETQWTSNLLGCKIISHISVEAINCFHVFWGQFKVKNLEGREETHSTLPQGASPVPRPGALSRWMGAGSGCRAALPVLSVQVQKPGNSSAGFHTLLSTPSPSLLHVTHTHVHAHAHKHASVRTHTRAHAHAHTPCKVSISKLSKWISCDRKQRNNNPLFPNKVTVGLVCTTSMHLPEHWTVFFLFQHPLNYDRVLSLSSAGRITTPPPPGKPK